MRALTEGEAKQLRRLSPRGPRSAWSVYGQVALSNVRSLCELGLAKEMERHKRHLYCLTDKGKRAAKEINKPLKVLEHLCCIKLILED